MLGPEGYGTEGVTKGYRHVPVPDDAEVGTFADQLLITLRSDWLGFSTGSLLATPMVKFLESAQDDATRKRMLTPLSLSPSS